MRESERADTAAMRVQLAQGAVRELVVAVGAAKLKLQSGAPTDWPDPQQAKEIILALPMSGRHRQAVFCAFDSFPGIYLAEQEFRKLAELFAFLEAEVDLRTHRELWLTRILRLATFAGAALCLGWYIATPRNIALDKRVTSSSSCPQAATARVAQPKMGRAVDGIRYDAPFAACTEKEVHPWIQVDLGTMHSIAEVDIYGRTDGNSAMDEIPAAIQVSLDGEKYETVGTTSLPLVIDLPWRFKVPARKARFVRLTSGSQRPQQFFIAEFEVYDR